MATFISLDMMVLQAWLQYFRRRGKQQHADTRPAKGVDLSRYLGRWYELARFETPFEQDMDEVYTEYRACPGGKINVANFGVGPDARHHEAHAIAYPVASGLLEIAFIPFLRFLRTSYHILKVDEAYRNALISNESGTCLWFLSRTPVAEPSAFDAMRREAISRGFDLSELRFTRQVGRS